MSDELKRIAVLSNEGRLIGSIDVPLEVEGIDPGDLPLNGTYKWMADHNQFMPVGTGFGKVLRPEPPYSTEYVISRIIDHLSAAGEVPGPLQEWQEWFTSDLRRREEEKLSLTRKPI